MTALARIAETGRAAIVVTRRGGSLNLVKPAPASIRVVDIAERLARTPADTNATGYYSLAQRSVLLANGVAPNWGALAGIYALLRWAPISLTGNVERAALGIGDLVFTTFQQAWQRLDQAICDALDLDSPVPALVGQALATTEPRLRLSEIRLLVRARVEESRALEKLALRPLISRIVPLNPDLAMDLWLIAFDRYASECSLPRTRAWEGVQ